MRKSISLLLAMGLAIACAREASDEADPGQTHGTEDTLQAQVIAATDYAPEYIKHATNVEMIPDVKAGLQTPSNGSVPKFV